MLHAKASTIGKPRAGVTSLHDIVRATAPSRPSPPYDPDFGQQTSRTWEIIEGRTQKAAPKIRFFGLINSQREIRCSCSDNALKMVSAWRNSEPLLPNLRDLSVFDLCLTRMVMSSLKGGAE